VAGDVEGGVEAFETHELARDCLFPSGAGNHGPSAMEGTAVKENYAGVVQVNSPLEEGGPTQQERVLVEPTSAQPRQSRPLAVVPGAGVWGSEGKQFEKAGLA
jgi:hypothetical protein